MLLIIWYLAAVYVLCVMQSFKNKYYVTDDDIYLINKFSILVLGSFLMANIVVFVLLIN